MKKIISIIRLLILIVLGVISGYLFFCNEQDHNIDAFILHVIYDKIIAICGFALTIRLHKRWCKTDPLIARIETWNNTDI